MAKQIYFKLKPKGDYKTQTHNAKTGKRSWCYQFPRDCFIVERISGPKDHEIYWRYIPKYPDRIKRIEDLPRYTKTPEKTLKQITPAQYQSLNKRIEKWFNEHPRHTFLVIEYTVAE